jgi:hypothetical protein
MGAVVVVKVFIYVKTPFEGRREKDPAVRLAGFVNPPFCLLFARCGAISR